MKRILHILITLCTGIACASHKTQVEVGKTPTWVNARPIDDGYYYGLGYVKKSSSSYQSLAKKNALADLVSEISVEISSSSLLRLTENNYLLQEEFRQSIRSKATESLVGYELAGVHEDETNYWVLYRLDKYAYQKQKDLEKQKAIELATYNLNTAEQLIKNGSTREGLLKLVHALEAVADYINEPLKVTLNNEEVFFASHIYSRIQQYVGEVKIKSEQAKYTGTRGKQLEILFTASYLNKPITDYVPVHISYTGNPIAQRVFTMDETGKLVYGISSLKGQKGVEYISAKLDFDKLIAAASSNGLVRQVVQKISVPEQQIQIVLQNPSLALHYKGPDVYFSSLSQAFREAGYLIVTSKPDYQLNITIQPKHQSNNKLHKYGYEAEMTIIETGTIQYSKHYESNYVINASLDNAKKMAGFNLDKLLNQELIPDLIAETIGKQGLF